jgi:hypothetical protein
MWLVVHSARADSITNYSRLWQTSKSQQAVLELLHDNMYPCDPDISRKLHKIQEIFLQKETVVMHHIVIAEYADRARYELCVGSKIKWICQDWFLCHFHKKNYTKELF